MYIVALPGLIVAKKEVENEKSERLEETGVPRVANVSHETWGIALKPKGSG